MVVLDVSVLLVLLGGLGLIAVVAGTIFKVFISLFWRMSVSISGVLSSRNFSPLAAAPISTTEQPSSVSRTRKFRIILVSRSRLSGRRRDEAGETEFIR